MTSWRDALVENLSATLKIVADKKTSNYWYLKLDWKDHAIDLPEVCNHFVQRFKVQCVTYERSPSVGTKHSARIFFYDHKDGKISKLMKSFEGDKHSIALDIVRSGT